MIPDWSISRLQIGCNLRKNRVLWKEITSESRRIRNWQGHPDTRFKVHCDSLDTAIL